MNQQQPPQFAPLINVIVESIDGENARHQHEAPSPEVWEAQADAFSNRLTARLIEVTAEEIKAGLGDTLCLHKAIYALDNVAKQLYTAYRLTGSAFIQIEMLRDHGEEPGA